MDKRLNEIDSVTSANDIVNVITLPSNADAKKATMTQLAEALIKTSEGKQIVAEAIGAYLTQAGLTTTFDGVVTTKNNKLSLINSDTLAQVVAGRIGVSTGSNVNFVCDGIYLVVAEYVYGGKATVALLRSAVYSNTTLTYQLIESGTEDYLLYTDVLYHSANRVYIKEYDNLRRFLIYPVIGTTPNISETSDDFDYTTVERLPLQL